MIIVEIAGRLGRDPETRFTPSGQKVSTLTVATNVRKSGKDETVWWRVTIWGDRFDKMLTYLKKGSAVIVIGEMGKPDIWTDKEGRPQVSLEITAEIIRFSPFGNPDRSGQESGNSNAHSGGSGFVREEETAHYQAGSGHGNGMSQGTAKTFATNSVEEEEDLPF